MLGVNKKDCDTWGEIGVGFRKGVRKTWRWREENSEEQKKSNL